MKLTKEQIKTLVQRLDGCGLDIEIDLTPDQIAVVRAEPKPWPQPNDVISVLGGDGVPEQFHYGGNTQICDKYIAMGMAFPTESAARHAADVQRALTAISEWQKANRPFVPERFDQGWYLTNKFGHLSATQVKNEWPICSGLTLFEEEDHARECATALPDAVAVLMGGE